MAGDMSVGPRTSRSEINEDSENRKQELVRDGEKKLETTRAHYKKQEDELRASGEAAVSHIKKAQNERFEATREKGEESLDKESETLRADYASLKKRGSDQAKALEDEEKQTRQRSEAAIASDRQKLALAQAADVKRLKADHEQATKDYEQTHAQGLKRLEDARDRDGKNLENERSESEGIAKRIQDKSRDQQSLEQKDGDRKLALIRSENDRRIRDLSAKASNTNRKVEENYSAEGQRVQVDGEADIAARRADAKYKLELEKENEKALLKQDQAHFTDEEKKLKIESDERFRKQTDVQQKTLALRGDEYRKEFDKSSEANQASLRAQREAYAAALYKQQQAYQSKVSSAESKSSDPFYSTRDFATKLEETPDSYVLKAKIPEYEKDSVDVHVRENRIVLQASRANEAKYEEDARKTSVNSYQTFRQEFELGKAVRPERVTKFVDSEGNLTVSVPKKALKA